MLSLFPAHQPLPLLLPLQLELYHPEPVQNLTLLQQAMERKHDNHPGALPIPKPKPCECKDYGGTAVWRVWKRKADCWSWVSSPLTRSCSAWLAEDRIATWLSRAPLRACATQLDTQLPPRLSACTDAGLQTVRAGHIIRS